MILQTSAGGSWTVGYKVIVQSDRGICGAFLFKWKAFAEKNNIEVGDVCVFQLIDRTKLSFKVIIYQNDDSPDCFQSQGIKCVLSPATSSVDLKRKTLSSLLTNL